MTEHRNDGAWTFFYLVVCLVGLLLVAIAAGGCSSDDGEQPPELESDCPGGLLCECTADEECDGYGLGGIRATCGGGGFCTHECSNANPCDRVLPSISCGPSTAALSLVCDLRCDELEHDAPCDELGLVGARCIIVANDVGSVDHVCAFY